MIRKISRLIKLSTLALILALAGWAYYVFQPLPLRRAIVDFEIQRGDTMRMVSARVASAGIDVWPFVLTWTARVAGHASHVKAGSYRIEQPISAWDLINLLSTGSNAYADLTVVEGWNFARVRAALNAHPDLKHDSLGLPDGEIMDKLGLGAEAPEGVFYPDTYSFARGSSDLELLRRAYGRMQSILSQEWSARGAGLPVKTAYEGLVLASIVEKETAKEQDRPLIASVFVNRLKIGMPLQSDPTVIYGMGQNYDGNLRKRDLQTDTVFNTYTRQGLPPTPIAMPGLAALRASLHPQPSDYLYFVARGDGTSKFSKSLDEHNKAVVQYQKKADKK